MQPLLESLYNLHLCKDLCRFSHHPTLGGKKLHYPKQIAKDEAHQSGVPEAFLQLFGLKRINSPV